MSTQRSRQQLCVGHISSFPATKIRLISLKEAEARFRWRSRRGGEYCAIEVSNDPDQINEEWRDNMKVRVTPSKTQA
jgi:hypothetical protein